MTGFVNRFKGDLKRGFIINLSAQSEDQGRPFILKATKNNQTVQIEFDDSEDLWNCYCHAMEYWQNTYGEADSV